MYVKIASLIFFLADLPTHPAATGAGIRFDAISLNVSAVEGDEALLTCRVLDINEQHIVAWKAPSDTVLTMGDEVQVAGSKYQLNRAYEDEWNLLIRSVRLNDQGTYLCLVNTDPPSVKTVSLQIIRPPQIILKSSSAAVVESLERSTVKLRCNAIGYPPPTIYWYRINPNNTKEKLHVTGHTLTLPNVSRNCDGTYECYARNAYKVGAKHQMQIVVTYVPEVWLEESLVLGVPGEDVLLSCFVKMNPMETVLWRDSRGREIHTSYKYTVHRKNDQTIEYSSKITLRISTVAESDFGMYSCFARNKAGYASQTAQLAHYSISRDSRRSTRSPQQSNLGSSSGVNGVFSLHGVLWLILYPSMYWIV